MDAKTGSGGRAIDDFGSPGGLLAAFAESLDAAGIALCAEFAEMVRADMSAEPFAICPTTAATDLLLAPMTAAESSAAKVMAIAARYARDAQLDDETLERLMTLATVYVARFDSYLAERSVPDHA